MIVDWGVFFLLLFAAALPITGGIGWVVYRLRRSRRYSLERKLDQIARRLGLARDRRLLGGASHSGRLSTGCLELAADRFGVLRARLRLDESLVGVQTFQATYAGRELISNRPRAVLAYVTVPIFRLIAFGGRIQVGPEDVVLETSLARGEAADLERAVRGLDAFAEGLRGGDPAVGTERNLTEPSAPDLRLAALRVAADELPDEAPAWLSRALGDPDPRVRLFAARRLGAAALPAVLGLVQDPRVPLDVLHPALGFLLQHGDRRRDLPLGLCRLGEVEGWMQAALLKAARQAELDTPAVHALARATRPEAASALVELLLDRADSECEELLVGLLDHPQLAVRRSVLSALARIGTPRAVGPIRARLRGLGLDRARAEAAMAAILARCPVDAGGGLALAAPAPRADGALSLAGAVGQLSVAGRRPQGPGASTVGALTGSSAVALTSAAGATTGEPPR